MSITVTGFGGTLPGFSTFHGDHAASFTPHILPPPPIEIFADDCPANGKRKRQLDVEKRKPAIKKRRSDEKKPSPFQNKLLEVLSKDRPQLTGVKELLIQLKDDQYVGLWYPAVAVVDRIKAGESLKIYARTTKSAYHKLFPKIGYIKILPSQIAVFRNKPLDAILQNIHAGALAASELDVVRGSQIYYLEKSPIDLRSWDERQAQPVSAVNSNKQIASAICPEYRGIASSFGHTEEVQIRNIKHFLANHANHYFHGALSREESESIILQQSTQHGLFTPFLVRTSSSDSSNFVVSHLHPAGGVTHFLLRTDCSSGMLTFHHNVGGRITMYTDLSLLLYHYFSNFAVIGRGIPSNVYQNRNVQGVESEYDMVQRDREQEIVAEHISANLFGDFSHLPAPIQEYLNRHIAEVLR
eukprot:CAMPEP_0174261340 /NCGR_PEP_ID=MMETSP0439-20130205/11372_1 /TAXON_ID=0 /ORGANISM="Stereomyxa ramosa, Strain Chinc5" /LENGTH=412 /DNA_ID=CAMNT_0015345797 /DNA_START=33 /DNA_END=1271 /DNA_ORIENTATION=-